MDSQRQDRHLDTRLETGELVPLRRGEKGEIFDSTYLKFPPSHTPPSPRRRRGLGLARGAGRKPEPTSVASRPVRGPCLPAAAPRPLGTLRARPAGPEPARRRTETRAPLVYFHLRPRPGPRPGSRAHSPAPQGPAAEPGHRRPAPPPPATLARQPPGAAPRLLAPRRPTAPARPAPPPPGHGPALGRAGGEGGDGGRPPPSRLTYHGTDGGEFGDCH